MSTPLKNNEIALDEFKNIGHQLDDEECEIINQENYGRLSEINTINDECQEKYVNKDYERQAKHRIKNHNQALRAYDMTVFQQDMKNCRKVVDTGHSMCLKNNESNCYKHEWRLAIEGIKKLNGLSKTTKSQNFTRDHIHKAAQRWFVYTKFPCYGFSSPFFQSDEAISKLAFVKPKKDAETLQREKEIRLERQQKRMEAEMKTKQAAKEQANEQEDYDQDDGQISTKILKAVENIIQKKIQQNVDNGLAAKIEYIPAVIDSDRKKGFGRTVENMFHLSFLVKDGRIGIELDRFNIPYIYIPGNDIQEAANNVNVKHQNSRGGKQGIMSMDKKTWRKYIELLELQNEKNMFANMNSRR